MAGSPAWAGRGFDGPAYLRKVSRKFVLGDPAAPPDRRAEAVAAEAFFADAGDGYSVFLVGDEVALQRVSVGYNGRRPSLTAELGWLLIRPEELTAAGVSAARTPGDTLCHFANARHYDLKTDPGPIVALCRLLVTADRPTLAYHKPLLKPWVERAVSDGCLAVPGATACRAAGCAPLTAALVQVH